MRHGTAGEYITISRVGAETAKAFIARPLPPEPHLNIDAPIRDCCRAFGRAAPGPRGFSTFRGVADTSKEAVQRSGRLLSLREKVRKKLANQGNAVRLLNELFKNPFVTVARAEKLLSVTNPTARQAVKRLEDAGILQETTGREWGRLYLARPILKIVDADDETNVRRVQATRKSYAPDMIRGKGEMIMKTVSSRMAAVVAIVAVVGAAGVGAGSRSDSGTSRRLW